MVRFVWLLLVISPVAAVAEEAHVLLVGSRPDHPYASHMYEFECQLLVKCLVKNEGVTAEYVPVWPPKEEQLAEADAIVFYSSPAGSVLLKDEHRAQFAQLMKRKVGFVAIHWGTGVGYDKISESQAHRDLFKSWLGGWFRRPPCDIKTTRADLRLVEKDHPIGRGWDEWGIHDEFYLNPVLHSDTKPLLEVTVDDIKHVVGWTFERPEGGRSVGITLGHFHHNFARDGFRRMLVNSILWSLRLDIPQSGAVVALAPGDVLLPDLTP